MNDATVFTFRGTERFEVLMPIGKGGMGAVYRARDRERKMDVALKTLLTFDAEALVRFKREFRALAEVSHPNLVGMHELFSEGRDWFFTMELVDGIGILGHLRKEARREVSPDAKTVRRAIDSGFVSSGVWAGIGFDEGRLRACLPQLVLGLDVLHAAGKVHRDVKPSNIMVTPTGRVVILDFGLVTDGDRRQQLSQQNVVGTVAYMAPEQAAGLPVGPAADWYALGVVLYEALTGIVPFVGTNTDVLMNKQRLVPQSPRSIVASVPRDLDALCCQLLRIEPKERPDAQAILECLGAKSSPRLQRSSIGNSLTSSAPFVGRAEELQALEKAYEQVRGGRACAVYVVGESGVGKTALVRRFTDHLELTEPDTEIRQGRCYEHETVPFKAFDSLFDDVARKLREWPRDDLERILPSQVGLLAQIFPVLRRVEAVADAAPAPEPAKDPHDQRARLFAAVRALFEGIAQKNPLVIVINDLQWADADSMALLKEVMRPPTAPLLLIITARDGSEPVQQLTNAIPGRTVRLDRLPTDQAIELATMLLRKQDSHPSVTAATIAKEAGGHPQFIDELIRYAGRNGLSSSQMVHLDEAIWSRLQLVDDATSRRLMEIIAVASGPLQQEAAGLAAEIAPGDFLRHLRILRTELFVRTQGTRATDSIEPYHNRIRSAVLHHLAPELVRAHHRRIALALEMGGAPDAAALTVHWLEAGENDRALNYARRAAERAEEALAFDRAAQFYELCIRLSPAGSDTRPLRVKLADAYVNAGRGGDAAAQYLLASQSAENGSAQRTIDELDLERKAAEQFLRSGLIDEGLKSMKNVLAALDMAMPKTTARALASLLYNRAWVRLRGFSFKERLESQITRERLAKIDLCWAVSAGLGVVDPLRGADYQTRQVRLALDAGEPYRVVRALAIEAAFVAINGGKTMRRTDQMLHLTRQLAHRVGRPHGIALATFAAGSVALLQGRWRDGVQLNQEAEVLFKSQCTGVSWELDTSRFFQLLCAFYHGEISLLLERVPELLREGEARGDAYALTNLRSAFTPLTRLAEDRPEEAIGETEAAVANWSKDNFHVQHYNALLGSVLAHLYAGRSAEAARILDESWSTLERSSLLIVEQMKIRALHLRGSTQAAVALQAGAERPNHLRRARADARRLKKSKSPWAVALGALLSATLKQANGDHEQAALALRDAIADLEATHMPLYAAAGRQQLGHLLGGDEGAKLISTANTYMRAQHIREPSRWAAMLAPGFGDA